MKTPRTETAVLVAALRILERDIQSGDGVANAVIAEAADRLAELERENAMLREITSMLGAPNHVGVPIEQWRALRADKERLEWLISKAPFNFFKELGPDLVKGRQQIDAARKEAQP